MTRLMPVTHSWWSSDDRAVVMAVCARLRPVSVLEFGPGASTLALLAGAVSHIDACEDNHDWAKVALERLPPERVRVVRYVWGDPLRIPALDGSRYDMALIDGPRITMNRIAVAQYCFDRCTHVLSPAEKDNRTYQPAFEALAAVNGRPVEFIPSGPPSFGFLLC
jgi:hypothetical protein